VRTLLRDLGAVSGVQAACIVRGGQVMASSFPDDDAVAQAASLGFVRGISDGLELVDRGFEELLIDFGAKSLMVAPVDKDFVLAMLAASDANLQLLRVVMGSSVRQLRRMHNVAEKPEPAPVQAPPPPRPEPAPAAAKPAPAAPPAAPAAAKPQAPAPPPPQAAKPQPTGRPQPQAKNAPPPPPLKGQVPRPAQQPPQAQAKQAAKPEPAPAAPPPPKPADKDAEPILPQVLALLTEYIGPVARVTFKRGVTKWRETSTPTVGTLGELAKILAADLSSDSEKKAFLDAVERLRGG